MLTTVLDDASYDQALAHEVVASGRLAPALLQPFAALPLPRPSFARWLIEAGLLDEDQVRARLDALRPEGWVPGGRVGDYVLRERLGAGGMGEVWHAVERTSGGERAIKTLLRSATRSHGERFAREVEALTRLDGHPNVVRVHAAGTAGGRPYVVLDFAPGGDLAGRLRRGPLQENETRRIMQQLAQGLAHVHRHGLLHRDLKPQNVLFAEDGRAMLTDFGVVRSEDHAALTLSGQLVGTLSYMAPEQAEQGPVDERSDVYGLGAVLYHMLCGEAPSSALFSKLRSPSDTNPAAPPDLVRVCMQATARKPERRYPSALAFAEALDLEAAPPRTGVLWLALGAALLGVLGVVCTALYAERAQSQAERGGVATASDAVTASGDEDPVPPRMAALEAFLASLPEPDPDACKGVSITAGMLPGVSMQRTVADALRVQQAYWQSAAYYRAAITDGDVDCWQRMARLFTDYDFELEEPQQLRRACLERGAEEGSAQAMLKLGYSHWQANGMGFPRDLEVSQAYYRRALDLAEWMDGTDPVIADGVRRQAWMCLVSMAFAHLGEAGVISALEALELLVRLEELSLEEEERARMRAITPMMLVPARADVQELAIRVEPPPPAEAFTEGQLLEAEVYPVDTRLVRYGLFHRRAGRVLEAAACFARGAEKDPRGWYELYRLLVDGASPDPVLPAGPRRTAAQLVCLAAAAAGEDPNALNVFSEVLFRGREGWPVEVDVGRATALARAGLERATDSDAIADLHLRLATIASLHHELAGCPTLAQGRDHLRACAALERPFYAERIEALEAVYARLEGE